MEEVSCKMGHIQHDIPSQAVTGQEVPVPTILYEVPDRYVLKMTEVTLTNQSGTDAYIILADTEGMNAVQKLDIWVPSGETVTVCGIMRHFAKNVTATNNTFGTIVMISSSGYLC